MFPVPLKPENPLAQLSRTRKLTPENHATGMSRLAQPSRHQRRFCHPKLIGLLKDYQRLRHPLQDTSLPVGSKAQSRLENLRHQPGIENKGLT
jgi:hypothetical protein